MFFVEGRKRKSSFVSLETVLAVDIPRTQRFFRAVQVPGWKCSDPGWDERLPALERLDGTERPVGHCLGGGGVQTTSKQKRRRDLGRTGPQQPGEQCGAIPTLPTSSCPTGRAGCPGTAP